MSSGTFASGPRQSLQHHPRLSRPHPRARFSVELVRSMVARRLDYSASPAAGGNL